MQKEDIQTIHQLSPPQQAILLHHLGNPGHDQGLILVRAQLEGSLDEHRARTLWQETLQNHETLRSCIRWQNLKKPVTIVAKTAEADLQWLDFSSETDEPVSSKINELINQEKQSGLNLTKLPNNRLLIIQIAPNQFRLLWTCHHLLLDGWSSNLVLQDFLQRLNNDSNSPAIPFRDYLSWLKQQPVQPAIDFWKNQIFHPCFLAQAAPPATNPSRAETEFHLSFDSQDLHAYSRQLKITSNVLFACAWALVLAKYTGSTTPACATVSSGRTVPLSDIENRVGMFASTAPVSFPFSKDTSVSTWLTESFQTLQQTYLHSHHAPSDILSWMGGSNQSFPFDSLFVHANFPQPEKQPGQPFHLSEIHSDTTSTFPLVAAVIPGSKPRLRFSSTPAFSPDQLAFLARLYNESLSSLINNSDSRIQNTLARLPFPPPREELPPSCPSASETEVKSHAEIRPHPSHQFVYPLLLNIWSEILEIDSNRINRASNFFELGGDSLRSLNLITRLKTELRLDLPFDLLFQAPTLEQLVDHLSKLETSHSWPSLVEIKKGTAPPLFLVHHIRGYVTPFYTLARHLPSNRPLFGLQSPREPFCDTVAMARAYLAEVVAEQPDGPYLLGGLCNGGVVALEMANQLRAKGKEVAFLGLIDSVPPEYANYAPSHQRLKELRTLISRIPKRSPKVIFRSLKRRLARQEATPENSNVAAAEPDPEFDAWLANENIPPAFLVSGPHRKATARHYAAVRDYQCSSYPGDIWLFRTKEARLDKNLGWDKYIEGKIHTLALSPRHLDLFDEPGITHLARELNQALESLPKP